MEVTILNFRHDPATVFAVFALNESTGVVACDRPLVLEVLEEDGIAVPDQENPRCLVYPRDGRRFMEALPRYFSGLLRAQSPRYGPGP